MEHVVVLRIRKECDDPAMTNAQTEQWVLAHFYGCEYGAVSVDSVRTEQHEEESE